MRLIKEYNEFILERKIDLVLEGRIVFSKEFKDTLINIDSDISKSLLSITNNDVDISTNYISKSDKNDIINFISNNKIKSFGYQDKAIIKDYQSKKLNLILEKIGEIQGISNFGNITRGAEVDILEVYNLDQFKSFLKERGVYGWYKEVEGNSPTYGEDYKLDETWNYNKVVLVKWNNKKLNLVRESSLKYDFIEIQDEKRSQMKIGRFVRRLLTKAGIEFTDKDIEDFVNKYKSRLEIEADAFRNFEIVSGEDIRKYYLESFHSINSGTLGQSCMRHKSCQDFFDIYVESKDCQLLILKDENSDDKIMGRALVWHVRELDRNKNPKESEPYIGYFMDRVYSVDEHGRQLFIDYAKENGWMYKSDQNSSSSTKLLINGVPSEYQNIYAIISRDEYDYYPYMDTMKYLNSYYLRSDKSWISFVHNWYHYGYDIELESTNGRPYCDTCGGEGYAECFDCGGTGTFDCDQCDGSGEEVCDDCGGDGEYENGNTCDTCGGQSMDCDNCFGSGEVDCEACYGSGAVTCDDCGGVG